MATASTTQSRTNAKEDIQVGRYLVRFDAESEMWDVIEIDPTDGSEDTQDWRSDRASAVRLAERFERLAAEEEAEIRAEELREEIRGRLDGMDLGMLEKIRAMMGK